MAFSSSFIFFFRPLLETHNHLPCILRGILYDSAQFQTHDTSDYKRLLQWQQNRSKATMWLLYKNSAIRGCPRRCYYIDSCNVTCYYPTTPRG